MSRTFIFTAAADPQAAARAVSDAPAPPDLAVVSPSASARKTAELAVGGRWIRIVEEPLLATRVPGESGGDALARLAQAVRGVQAFDARTPLVVLDRLDILGASAFLLDEEGLAHLADGLESALPLP
jgi:hypothetical protein